MSLPHDAAGFDGGTNAPRGHPKSLGEFVDCRTPSGSHRATSQLAQPGYGDTGRIRQGLNGPTTTVKDGLPQVPKGLGHARCVAESGGKDNPPLDSGGGKCDKVQHQEHGLGVIRQDSTEPAGPVTVRNETVSTNTKHPSETPGYWLKLARDERAFAAADRHTRTASVESIQIHERNAAAYEARAAALTSPPEPVLLPLCRHCDEPIPLMRLSAPYRDDLCDDCDSAFCEQMSRDYELERAADAPYHGRR